MAKKRAMNEQDKINLAKGKKFSKENQPSPEAKRKGHQKKKTMRAMLDYLLEKELTSKNGEKATTLEAMMTAMIKQGLNGNVKAVEFIRDTTGQKPVDKQLTVEGTKEDLEVVIDKEGIQAEIEKTRMLADE